MTSQPKAPSHRLEDLLEFAGSVVTLAVLLAIVGAAFFGAHRFMLGHGLTSDLLHSAYAWVGVGAVCSLVWPLRYHRGMRGHWGSFWPGFPLLALTGPFALLLGFPM